MTIDPITESIRRHPGIATARDGAPDRAPLDHVPVTPIPGPFRRAFNAAMIAAATIAAFCWGFS